MNKNPLNVQLYSPKDNQEIIEEIKEEYIRGGHNLSFVQPREKFYKDLEERFKMFDFISHALEIGNRKTLMHLVQKGTRFGIFAGSNLSIYCPIEYLQLIPIDLGKPWGLSFMTMNEEGKWGIPKKTAFWSKDSLILPHEFEDIKSPSDSFYPVKKNGKWGLYYSICKSMVINPQYEEVLGISEGLIAVKKDGKWGFVDIFNNVVVSFEYDSVSNFNYGYSHAIKSSAFENKGSVMIDHIGNEIVFNNIRLTDDEYRKKISVKESYDNHITYYYAVGPDNDIIIPKNKYRYLGAYREGLFAASVDGKTYGYIDINEKIIIPFQYQNETYRGSFGEREFNFGLVCAKLNNSMYSRDFILINHSNIQVFPYTFHGDFLTYNNGAFSKKGWSDLGERFKRGYISLFDLINYQNGKDMSYLIRSDEEVEKEKIKRKKIRELEEPYQWTEEDTWDAMTDGMYGDYPGGDVDYEKFGF